jgi:putative addiction module component (TIGR02574 family)
MTDKSHLFDFSHLTVDERIELAMQLWDSIHPYADQIPVTEAQMQELDRRMAAYDAGEMSCSTWDAVKRRLTALFRKPASQPPADAFGQWKGRSADGVCYQQALRDEWEN